MSPERISAISSQNNNVKIDFNSRDSREANSIVELGATNNFIHICICVKAIFNHDDSFYFMINNLN